MGSPGRRSGEGGESPGSAASLHQAPDYHGLPSGPLRSRLPAATLPSPPTSLGGPAPAASSSGVLHSYSWLPTPAHTSNHPRVSANCFLPDPHGSTRRDLGCLRTRPHSRSWRDPLYIWMGSCDMPGDHTEPQRQSLGSVRLPSDPTRQTAPPRSQQPTQAPNTKLVIITTWFPGVRTSVSLPFIHSP